MGIRLNTMDSLAFGMRNNSARIGVAPADFGADQAVLKPDTQKGLNVRHIQSDNFLQGPPTVGTADAPAVQGARSDEADELGGNALQLAAINAQADTGNMAGGTAAPEVRVFRFLTNPGSVHERELNARFNQLERRLDSTSKRLQFADSTIERVDATLEHARLEQDMDMIAGEIRRMRLEQIFSKTSVAPAPSRSEQSAEQRSTAAGVTTAQDPVLNLLA